jgi:hypothetical protein
MCRRLNAQRYQAQVALPGKLSGPGWNLVRVAVEAFIDAAKLQLVLGTQQ